MNKNHAHTHTPSLPHPPNQPSVNGSPLFQTLWASLCKEGIQLEINLEKGEGALSPLQSILRTCTWNQFYKVQIKLSQPLPLPPAPGLRGIKSTNAIEI